MIGDIYFTTYLLSLLTSINLHELLLSIKIKISSYPHTNIYAMFKMIFSFQLFLESVEKSPGKILNQRTWRAVWEKKFCNIRTTSQNNISMFEKQTCFVIIPNDNKML